MTTLSAPSTLFGLILLLATNVTRADHEQPLDSGWVEFDNGTRVMVELATTSSQREYGLMHRNNLPENHGMLFVYPTETKQAMWMKNMLLALDVVFIADSGQIVSILQDIPPCKQEPCPVYKSLEPAKYMLEVNAGFTAQHLITPGQTAIIDYQHD